MCVWEDILNMFHPLILSSILSTLQECQLLQTILSCHSEISLWEYIFSLNDDHINFANAVFFSPFPDAISPPVCLGQTYTMVKGQAVFCSLSFHKGYQYSLLTNAAMSVLEDMDTD